MKYQTITRATGYKSPFNAAKRTKIVHALMKRFQELTSGLTSTETMSVVCDLRTWLNSVEEKDLTA